MRHLHRLFRITLLLALGVLALGPAALAQDLGFEVLESDPTAEAGAPAELFDKLDAALAALDETVITVATDDEIAQIAEEVTALLAATAKSLASSRWCKSWLVLPAKISSTPKRSSPAGSRLPR